MTFIKKTSQYLSAKPERLFWAFAFTHLIAWTLLPSLICPNLPLDIVEGYAWGKEWLIGTHKHPPMQAWILEALFNLTGHGRWAPYLASQIAIVTAFWAVWQTGRRIADEKVGLVGAMMLEGIIYYNFTSPEFNPNVLQIPFWALCGLYFFKGIKDNKLSDWMLLGLWAAAGMYSKYSTGLFLLILMAAGFAHRDGRKRFLNAGPYISVLIAVVLFLPHLSWLMQNHFLPFQYTEGRLERNTAHYSSFITTGLLLAGQLIALMFFMVLVVALYDRRHASNKIKAAASFDRIFLSFAAFGPFAIMFCMSLVFGYHIRDMWVTPFWNFIGLWVLVFMRPAMMPQDLRRFALAWALVFTIGLLMFTANEVFSPFVTSKPKRTIFPGKHLARFMTETWHDKYHRPLEFVIGDVWPAGNVAWYSEDRPDVFMEGDTVISPWIDTERLKKVGGIIVWCIQCGQKAVPNAIPAEIKAEFPQAELQTPASFERITFADVPPAIVGWAIIPPTSP